MDVNQDSDKTSGQIGRSVSSRSLGTQHTGEWKTVARGRSRSSARSQDHSLNNSPSHLATNSSLPSTKAKPSQPASLAPLHLSNSKSERPQKSEATGNASQTIDTAVSSNFAEINNYSPLAPQLALAHEATIKGPAILDSPNRAPLIEQDLNAPPDIIFDIKAPNTSRSRYSHPQHVAAHLAGQLNPINVALSEKSRIQQSPLTSNHKSDIAVDSSLSSSKVDKDKPTSSPNSHRPLLSSRTVSTPSSLRRKHSSFKPNTTIVSPTSTVDAVRPVLPPIQLDHPVPRIPESNSSLKPQFPQDPLPSPISPPLPLPPISLPTYLQLELSSSRPSSSYIHRSANSDLPYESSSIKFDRLLNFLLLPPQLEQVLWFGTLACLDAWLYSFTILPLRFFKASGILIQWWGETIVKEAQFIFSFIYLGAGRMWLRHGKTTIESKEPTSAALLPEKPTSHPLESSLKQSTGLSSNPQENPTSKNKRPESYRTSKSSFRKHRRSISRPSALLSSHKADLLKGLVVLFTCLILTRFDASRMYHGIKGQAAIKLYVIYNVLEVSDRLLSALGQDIFECLFSRETLERKADGRSKVLRPFGMFLLALCYNVIHSIVLFFQVITLNVAVNSYSNALLTLITSNQFVEIKSTVFKKFEKENLFQLTCADIVERFQLWLMLIIIALRNIVAVGITGLGIGFSSSTSGTAARATIQSSSILPTSFTIFPQWAGQLSGPFFLVLGSEMLVDWLKHAYISKFNNIKPDIYGRFLDILAKDYYSDAFTDQSLIRRVGLPVIPLASLFMRASLQTYHMFLAEHVPQPIPPTSASFPDGSSATSSPVTTAALQHLDVIIRTALGRSSFGAGNDENGGRFCSTDDAIASIAMVIFFVGIFFVLLALKLVLGILLLRLARNRYRGMRERQKQATSTTGRRLGGWGVVEVDEEKRRWIYQDDPEGLQNLREREKSVQEKDAKAGTNFGPVQRYSMVGKRIW
ncbi:MAG: hypothetical protein M1829_006505 [Trizodia sp. TS-e1964]|nr:MAG: hypothetical protein M1829_006505 [Trizodia sp. TS-e1964]